MEKQDDVIHCRKRNFRPIKNPLNTTPVFTEEAFKKNCLNFYNDMEKQLKHKEDCFENRITEYRNTIKEMHQKLKESYKNLFQFMLNNIYDDNKKELLEAISLMIEHVNYSEGFSQIMKNAVRLINEGKKPALDHDPAQYVYGTKPLYFEFDDEDE